MKLVTFEASFGEAHNIKEEKTLIYPEGLIRVLPDTALLSGGRPFFVPDLPGPVTGHQAWGVRVSRLGRHIAERFSSRYYDAVTTGICFEAEKLLEMLHTSETGGSAIAAYGFDGAVSIGAWKALPEDNHLEGEIRTQAGTLSFTEENWRKKADLAVSLLSRYFTLRQGDILLMKTRGRIEAEEDDHVAGWLQGERLLDFNIK